MNIKFDSEHVYGDNVKYRDKVNTNFQDKKYQKKVHHKIVCH